MKLVLVSNNDGLVTTKVDSKLNITCIEEVLQLIKKNYPELKMYLLGVCGDKPFMLFEVEHGTCFTLIQSRRSLAMRIALCTCSEFIIITTGSSIDSCLLNVFPILDAKLVCSYTLNYGVFHRCLYD